MLFVGKENRLKMTAPRKVKLMKPRPLRSSKADENGNESNKSNENIKDAGKYCHF